MSICKVPNCYNTAIYGILGFFKSRCEIHKKENMVKNSDELCDICSRSNERTIATYIQYNADNDKIEYRCDIHINREIYMERTKNDLEIIMNMINNSEENSEIINNADEIDEVINDKLNIEMKIDYINEILNINMNLDKFMDSHNNSMEVYKLLKCIDNDLVDTNSKIYKDFILLSKEDQDIVRDNNYYGKFDVNEKDLKKIYNRYLRFNKKSKCIGIDCNITATFGIYSMPRMLCLLHTKKIKESAKDMIFSGPKDKCSYFKICEDCKNLERCNKCINKENSYRCARCPRCDNCNLCLNKFGLYRIYICKKTKHYICRNCSYKVEECLPRTSINGKPIIV